MPIKIKNFIIILDNNKKSFLELYVLVLILNQYIQKVLLIVIIEKTF